MQHDYRYDEPKRTSNQVGILLYRLLSHPDEERFIASDESDSMIAETQSFVKARLHATRINRSSIASADEACHFSPIHTSIHPFEYGLTIPMVL